MVDVRLFSAVDLSAELARWQRTPVNYTLDGPPTAAAGWHVDEYCRRLPDERPGEPVPDGPYTVACRLIRDYEFADPTIIRGVWLPDSRLQGRTMLLAGRFLALTFLLGVRVSTVVDETVEQDGQRLRVWGWCYRTLVGHLEAGEMCYRAVKNLDTGEVSFRICRYVRSERIDNPFLRLGWRVFGRPMQVLFVRRSMARMTRLVDAALLGGRGPGPHTGDRPGGDDQL